MLSEHARRIHLEIYGDDRERVFPGTSMTSWDVAEREALEGEYEDCVIAEGKPDYLSNVVETDGGERWCLEHEIAWADCPCPGPHGDGE
jgi:hypothetical protein